MSTALATRNSSGLDLLDPGTLSGRQKAAILCLALGSDVAASITQTPLGRLDFDSWNAGVAVEAIGIGDKGPEFFRSRLEIVGPVVMKFAVGHGKAGDRIQESGVRSQESGVRSIVHRAR